MNLDDGAVQTDRLQPNPDQLFGLHPREHAIKHASLGPAIQACIDRVPVAEAFGQCTPFAAVFGHVQHGVEHLQVVERDTAALPRQAIFDAAELRRC